VTQQAMSKEQKLIQKTYNILLTTYNCHMFKNYLKTAWRNLWKNKFFSVIKIHAAIPIARPTMFIAE